MSDTERAQTLLDAAQQAAEEERYGDAIAAFDDVVERYGDATDASTSGLVGEALYRKAFCLHRIEREEEALATYEELAARYRGAQEFGAQLSRALFHQASTLVRLGRPEEAITVWEELQERYGDATEPPLAMGLAAAFEGKAAALRRLERPDEALGSYDDLIIRFSDSTFPVLRHRADSALSEKVFVLLLLRRYEEAIVVANAAVARLREAHDADALAIAVLNLGGALANEGRFDEAVGVYDALIDQLADSDSPELRGRLILAISNKVEALTMLGRGEEAVSLHAVMLERFGDEVPRAFAQAAARNEHEETAKAVVAGLLLKEALVLAELDRTQEALIAVNNLVDRFRDEEGENFARVMAVARELREQLLADQ
jgi:tetratricopeptide (TPR) repeat protein